MNDVDGVVTGASDEQSAIGRQGAAPEGGPLTLSEPSLYDGSLATPIKSLPNAPKPSKGAKEPAA